MLAKKFTNRTRGDILPKLYRSFTYELVHSGFHAGHEFWFRTELGKPRKKRSPAPVTDVKNHLPIGLGVDLYFMTSVKSEQTRSPFNGYLDKPSLPQNYSAVKISFC